jgi:DNA-binding NarL/FixJ family response regulator
MENKINILLLDDSAEITYRLRSILKEIKKIGEIEIADTLRFGRTKAIEKEFDIVILDIQLPDGDGIEFLKWIKEKYPKIIVMMFSSFSEKFFRSLTKRLGADYFFDKFTEFEKISKTIIKMN